VRYDRDRLEDLDPAFAMTVHKSQGSEFSVVILAISSGSPLLNNRNLLYTAITRARKKLFIVSDRRTIDRMIHNRSQAERFTSLKDFIAFTSPERKPGR
jgi:exodeoxyribonuclease V alpha subunit